ncbi:MAG: IS3 family transposase, partial [Pseudomonadota bacterium]|nr:IS3 family transposase [Pseudomonadota bacterium]
PRTKTDKILVERIIEHHKNSRKTYGYRRIHEELYDEGLSVSETRVRRLMKHNGIKAKLKKRFKVTTDSNHTNRIHENILARNFKAESPNQSWVSDITYIPTKEGWLYLAVIMDLFSRKIIGWAMDSRMQESLTINALNMALLQRKIKSPLLLHSDRGSQYAATNYQTILNNNSITCSMSRRGNCWDNAPMESFFHTLKVELVHHESFKTREEAKQALFDYIEVFYNRQRRHSAINYKSPEQFELMQAA